MLVFFHIVEILIAAFTLSFVLRSRLPEWSKLSFGIFFCLGLVFPRVIRIMWQSGLRFPFISVLSQFIPLTNFVSLLALLGFGYAVAIHSTDKPVERKRTIPGRDRRVWDTDLTPRAKHIVLRRREWAFLIDHAPFMLYIVFYGVVVAISNDRTLYGFVASLGVIPCLWWIFYLPAKDALGGQSIGKSLVDSRVVDFETGTPIELSQSLIRNFLLVIPGFALIEFAVALTRPDRRRLGDLLAGTIVVKGQPKFIDGEEVAAEAIVVEEPAKHPLD